MMDGWMEKEEGERGREREGGANHFSESWVHVLGD